MTTFGYTLSSEEHAPGELVRHAVRAEECGFDFVGISDHYHPWIRAQGHSPFVWTVLGAAAEATSHIRFGVGVCCPTTRVHPAIVAQAAATTSQLLRDRFFLGLGTGEALNEHILGHRWPPPAVRTDMLAEAVEVIRRLWTGETVDHEGRFYRVENARLFDPPEGSVPICISAFGPGSADLAARIGDGYWGTSPSPELVDRYRAGGGTGPAIAQLHVCWATDEDAARRTAAEVWPNAGITGQMSQDLPTWTHFEEAASMLTPGQATGSIPCGPAVEPVLESVRRYEEAGYDHLYFHQIGPDQEGFFGFWNRELRPALEGALSRTSAR